jgi:hypothetical protein
VRLPLTVHCSIGMKWHPRGRLILPDKTLRKMLDNAVDTGVSISKRFWCQHDKMCIHPVPIIARMDPPV